MGLKEKLLALLEEGDNEVSEPSETKSEPSETKSESSETEKPSSEPNGNAPESKNIEPENKETTEIKSVGLAGTEGVSNAQLISPSKSDITVVTTDNVLAESFDLRLGSLTNDYTKLEATVKILLAEVEDLKNKFVLVEKAIDVAANTSATVENIDTLINML